VPPNSCQILIILEFSLQILKKNLNMKFHENPFDVKLCCSTRTEIKADRHDKADSRFPKFCEKGLKFVSPKILTGSKSNRRTELKIITGIKDENNNGIT